MTPAARVQSAIELLDQIIVAARDGGAAADVVAARFFKERRYAGSGDRRTIRDLAWRVIRLFGERPESGRAAMVALAEDDSALAAHFTGGAYAPAMIDADEARAVAQPVDAWLAPLLDPHITTAELEALLVRAPLDLRVARGRLAETTGDPLFAEATPLPPPLSGLRLPVDSDVASSPAFLSGAVEVQDAGSQWVAQLCEARAGALVVDLCAGAGGKTLALADAMVGEGRIIATDTDRSRLQNLTPRAERAGAGMIETRLLNPGQELEQLADLHGTADVVLIDAPCSGSGTWRRNPEGRWRLTGARLERLLATQAHVLNVGAKLVAPGGRLVYAVCSIIGAEGEAQVDRFCADHGDFSATDVSQQWPTLGRAAGVGRLLTPLHDGTDGFFVACLERRGR